MWPVADAFTLALNRMKGKEFLSFTHKSHRQGLEVNFLHMHWPLWRRSCTRFALLICKRRNYMWEVNIFAPSHQDICILSRFCVTVNLVSDRFSIKSFFCWNIPAVRWVMTLSPVFLTSQKKKTKIQSLFFFFFLSDLERRKRKKNLCEWCQVCRRLCGSYLHHFTWCCFMLLCLHMADIQSYVVDSRKVKGQRWRKYDWPT